LVRLDETSIEFKKVRDLVLSTQYTGHSSSGRQLPYVKGRIGVTKIERVQSPQVYERYLLQMRFVAEENGGDANERWLWHGTDKTDLVIAEGFDPRVCNLKGMFGAGAYFAEQSTKSVRYAGAKRPGDAGQMLLCRVALGNQMVVATPMQVRTPPRAHTNIHAQQPF
jgi:hypothetical protein